MFIYLKSTNGQNLIRIRPEAIEVMFNGTLQSAAFKEHFNGARLFMASGKEIAVRETPEQIEKLIKDYEKHGTI